MVPQSAYAAPDAGSLQNQIDRERETVPPSFTYQNKNKTGVSDKPLTGKTFVVKEFFFEGNTLLTNEELNVATSFCRNKEVDFDHLKACSTMITEAYQAEGWVAKAVMPPQDIIDGKVNVKVIEAKFGRPVIAGKHAERVSDEQIQSIFDFHQKSLDLLNMNALDRALLLADDLPGVGVSGDLDQGSDDGLTNIVLKLADEPFFSGNTSLDNQGSIQTGINRFNGSLNFNSPLGLGDLLTLSVMASDGNRYLRVEDTLPIGSSGLRFGMNASGLTYCSLPLNTDNL